MNRTLKPFDNGKRKNIVSVEEALRELEGYEPPQEEIVSEKSVEDKLVVGVGDDFHIQEFSGHPPCYRLSNVEYFRGRFLFDLSKRRDNGPMSYNSWIEATQTTKFKLPTTKTYYLIMKALYYNMDHPNNGQGMLVEKVRGMLEREFKSGARITSTTLESDDPLIDTRIMHDEDYTALTASRGSLQLKKNIGTTQKITPVRANQTKRSLIDALFGTRDNSEVYRVLTWFGGKEKPPIVKYKGVPGRFPVQVYIKDGVFTLDATTDVDSASAYANLVRVGRQNET